MEILKYVVDVSTFVTDVVINIISVTMLKCTSVEVVQIGSIWWIQLREFLA